MYKKLYTAHGSVINIPINTSTSIAIARTYKRICQIPKTAIPTLI